MLNDVETINKLRRAFDESVISQVCSSARKTIVQYCRLIAAECCRRKGETNAEICNKLHRNRTTVIYYENNFRNEYEYNKEFRNLADKVLKE